MTKGRDRVICVSLSEAEWKAFLKHQPEPVAWLRQQILGQLGDLRDLPPPQRMVRIDRVKAWSTRRV